MDGYLGVLWRVYGWFVVINGGFIVINGHCDSDLSCSIVQCTCKLCLRTFDNFQKMNMLKNDQSFIMIIIIDHDL